MRTCTFANMHTCTHGKKHTFTHALMYIYTCTHLHTHASTNTHTQTHPRCNYLHSPYPDLLFARKGGKEKEEKSWGSAVSSVCVCGRAITSAMGGEHDRECERDSAQKEEQGRMSERKGERENAHMCTYG